MRCFPQHWAPDGEQDRLDWFHKYVVEQVVQNDLVAGGPQMVTDYEYVGDPAWHYDDDDGITPPKRKTWSQYRGYSTVKVRTGATGGTRSLTETRYFRGMDGDKQQSGTPREISLTSTEGDTYADHWRRAGQPFETTTYNGSEVISKVINEPWLSAQTAERVMEWGTSRAYLADTAQVKTYTALDGGRGWRKGAVQREFDGLGIASQVTDWGEIGKDGDETCTKYTPDKGVSTLTYDVLGRVATTTDARNKTLAFTYDELSRKTGMYEGSTAGTKLAEWKGLPGSATRWSGGQAFVTKVEGYDDQYRPTKTTVTIPSKDGLTTYASAGTGTLAGNHSFSTTYNFDGTIASRRLPTAGDLPLEIVTRSYDLFGMQIRTQSNASTYVTDSA